MVASCKRDEAYRSVGDEAHEEAEGGRSQPPTPVETISLRVTLQGHGGARLAAGRVALRRNAHDRPASLAELAAGSSEVELALPGAGFYWLEAQGVDHAPMRVGLLVEAPTAGTSPRVSVRLGTYPIVEGPEVIEMRAEWRTEGEVEEVVDGVRIRRVGEMYDADGLLAAAPREATQLRYQLRGFVPEDRAVNGTLADRYVAGAEGNYWSELDLEGRTRLRIPAPVVESTAKEPELSLVAVSLAGTDAPARWIVQVAETLASDERGEHTAQVARAARDSIEALPEGPERRARAAGFASLFVFQIDPGADDPSLSGPELVTWVFDELPADALEWCHLDFALLDVVVGLRGDARAEGYFARMAESHPDPGVQSILLFAHWQAAAEIGDVESAARVYEKLATHYADTDAFAYAKAEMDAPHVLEVGRPMPDWRLPNLDRPKPRSAPAMSGPAMSGPPAKGVSRVLASANLRGRPYLFHVWATWCGVCRAEMKGLHEAYEAVNGAEPDGAVALEFVSVLGDDAPELGRQFREEVWPLPWRNAYLPPERFEELEREWGLRGFPTLVLVDAEGQIVAAGEALREEALLPTLRRFLASAEG